ncbi:MAG: GNAT family N-acetyltransferase [Caldilineaceae bacterium]|nr:GNAT family N-acetyltransferase [Caldilineaceae bacterium]
MPPSSQPGADRSLFFAIRPAARADRWLIIRRILREGLDPTKLDWRRFVVAQAADGEVLGIAQMKDLGDDVQEFGSLIVEPTARGQGVGAALIRHLVAPCETPIYLLCGERNVAYYLRLGFAEIQETEMPAPLRRKWRAGNFFARRLGSRVAAMILERT